MKKIATLFLALAATSTVFAQGVSEPNRLIVTDATNSQSVYVLGHVNDITFDRINGEVSTKIAVSDVSTSKLVLSVTRTEECKGFKIAVIPTLIAKTFTSDLSAIKYLDSSPYISEAYYQDFSAAEMTGISLSAGTDYSVCTINLDKYGVEASFTRVDFSTPAADVAGNPQVSAEVTDTQLYEFTVSFTPNSDVKSYYFVAGEAGTMQQQYESFAPMFGFANFGEMIQSWGVETTGKYSYTWKNMAPNTDYEVFIQPLDKNGNFGAYQVITVRTLDLGGSGDAKVDITLGDYVLNEWDGEMKPSQFITFTPNDDASCYRFGVYLESLYTPEREEIIQELCSDPDQAYAYWFFYEPLTSDFQIDPGTKAVAIAAAKNADNVWGPVNEYFFTTPDQVQGKPSAFTSTGTLASRIHAAKVNNSDRAGMIPVLTPVKKPVLK
jgi:hypothetical protein